MLQSSDKAGPKAPRSKYFAQFRWVVNIAISWINEGPIGCHSCHCIWSWDTLSALPLPTLPLPEAVGPRACMDRRPQIMLEVDNFSSIASLVGTSPALCPYKRTTTQSYTLSIKDLIPSTRNTRRSRSSCKNFQMPPCTVLIIAMRNWQPVICVEIFVVEL